MVRMARLGFVLVPGSRQGIVRLWRAEVELVCDFRGCIIAPGQRFTSITRKHRPLCAKCCPFYRVPPISDALSGKGPPPRRSSAAIA